MDNKLKIFIVIIIIVIIAITIVHHNNKNSSKNNVENLKNNGEIKTSQNVLVHDFDKIHDEDGVRMEEHERGVLIEELEKGIKIDEIEAEPF